MKTVFIVAVFAAAVHALAASTTDITIAPGSRVMSAEELAIVADAGKGLQHGVILVDETERNDDAGGASEIAYHRRAKILSPEARSLADIAIPVEHGSSDLKKFWGRTIFPDGRVQELSEPELKVQFLLKTSYGKAQELRGALPGVAPGCVIDYGYVVRSLRFFTSTRVFLQTSWPVRSMRFRWVASHFFPAAFTLARAEGLSIAAKHDAKSVLVTAFGLPAVLEEPHMPPLEAARASVTFYYSDSNETTQDYWDHEARNADQQLKSFLSGNAVSEVLATLPVAKDASTDERLRAAYAWIGKNIRNSWLTSAEEAETKRQDDKEAYNAKMVLKAKEGSPRQLDSLFAGMARALGAEARLVFAVDRSDRLWNQALKSMDQFAYTFVAVRAPGEPADKLVFVDAGSGLPYGEVPWRATGTSALLCAGKTGTPILVPPSSPVTNRADSKVTLSFSEENESMLAKWDRTAVGAEGASYRQWLRDLDTRERKEQLDLLCGASGMNEVTAAELPGLDDTTAPFRIACEAENSDLRLNAETSTYALPVMGPWWTETPEFTEPTRVQPVLFDYPLLEVTAIDVTAPRGFKPKAAPAPVKLESPYGRYMLNVVATPTGFHVDRVFALTVLLAQPAEYAALRKYFEDVRNADRVKVNFERVRNTP